MISFVLLMTANHYHSLKCFSIFGTFIRNNGYIVDEALIHKSLIQNSTPSFRIRINTRIEKDKLCCHSLCRSYGQLRIERILCAAGRFFVLGPSCSSIPAIMVLTCISCCKRRIGILQITIFRGLDCPVLCTLV